MSTENTPFVVIGDEAMLEGVVLRNVHSPAKCDGGYCVIHNPSEHYMRAWPFRWDGVTKTLSRQCPHGRWHPDPDVLAYWRQIEHDPAIVLHAWFECDGCCGA